MLGKKELELQSLGWSLAVEWGCLKVFLALSPLFLICGSWGEQILLYLCAWVCGHIPILPQTFLFSVLWPLKTEFLHKLGFFLDFSELILHSQQCSWKWSAGKNISYSSPVQTWSLRRKTKLIWAREETAAWGHTRQYKSRKKPPTSARNSLVFLTQTFSQRPNKSHAPSRAGKSIP